MRVEMLRRGLLLAILSVPLACAAGGDNTGTELVRDTGSSGDDTSFSGDGTSDPDFGFGGDGVALDSGSAPDFGADAFWADDPPPKSCGDAGVTPVVPGGTPECPDDKNREGCPCLKEGETASCWPGFRKNRNRGICKDGTTTCKKKTETTLAWGPCEGYTLPIPGGTGKDACQCFSGGEWKLDNLSPCFWSSGGVVTGATSTTISGTTASCPSTFDAPTASWAHTTLKVDCAGHFKLCYTLKAGKSTDPKTTDCVLTTQCAEGDYTVPNVTQKWGDLKGWKSTDAACAKAFDATGGYGEMSVEGTSIECDKVSKVFLRVGYCSSKCSTTPTLPECAGCSTGGGGTF